MDDMREDISQLSGGDASSCRICGGVFLHLSRNRPGIIIVVAKLACKMNRPTVNAFKNKPLPQRMTDPGQSDSSPPSHSSKKQRKEQTRPSPNQAIQQGGRQASPISRSNKSHKPVQSQHPPHGKS